MAVPSRLASLKPSWVDEFRAFIMRGSVVDLAVGIIIGFAIFWVVKALTRLHVREEAQTGPKAEEILIEIRDILKAEAGAHPAVQMRARMAAELCTRLAAPAAVCTRWSPD